jgi:hypothetical protein
MLKSPSNSSNDLMSGMQSPKSGNESFMLSQDLTGWEVTAIFNTLISHVNRFTEALAIKSSYHSASNNSIEWKRQKRLIDAIRSNRVKEVETFPCDVITASILTLLAEKSEDLLPRCP